MTVSLRNLCLLCFLIPIITIIISFVWSANLNLISWCIPNFEGCTSISRVGRYEPVKYFFKPLMFIYAVFLYYFWKKYYEFLLKNKINLSKFLKFSPAYLKVSRRLHQLVEYHLLLFLKNHN